MIPTMIVFGLVVGRWWRTALVAAAVVWPAILLADGVFAGSTTSTGLLVIGAALLSVANTAVGVAVHQVVHYVVRRAVGSIGRPQSPPS